MGLGSGTRCGLRLRSSSVIVSASEPAEPGARTEAWPIDIAFVEALINEFALSWVIFPAVPPD